MAPCEGWGRRSHALALALLREHADAQSHAAASPRSFVHNVAEGLVVAVPLYAGTGNARLALALTALSGLSEPVGALLGMVLLRSSWLAPMVSRAVAATLCAVAGVMMEVSVSQLLPQVGRPWRRYRCCMWRPHHIRQAPFRHLPLPPTHARRPCRWTPIDGRHWSALVSAPPSSWPSTHGCEPTHLIATHHSADGREVDTAATWDGAAASACIHSGGGAGSGHEGGGRDGCARQHFQAHWDGAGVRR